MGKMRLLCFKFRFQLHYLIRGMLATLQKALGWMPRISKTKTEIKTTIKTLMSLALSAIPFFGKEFVFCLQFIVYTKENRLLEIKL